MRRAVLAGTVATSLVAGAAAGVILGVPVTAQSGERPASSPKISIAAATIAAVAAAVPAAAAPATTAPAAPAAPADDAAPAAAPAAVPAAATAHAHVPTSLPATSLHASTGARAAAGTADAAGELLVVASTLHMALSDLRSALAAGKSLAQIATAAGIDPNKLIAAVVNDATAKINAAVSLGMLSRAECDKIIAMLPGLVTHTFGAIGAGFAPGSKLAETLGSLGKLASLGNFAKLGKLDGTGDFKSSFINMFGSFGNLGQANPGANIDPQALISSIVSMATDAVNAALSAGLLTQAQASTILAELTPAITSLVHTTLDASSNLQNQAAGWASLGSSWMAHLHH